MKKMMCAFLAMAIMVVGAPLTAMAAEPALEPEAEPVIVLDEIILDDESGSIDLLEYGNWYIVDEDGNREPMPRIVIGEGMKLESGQKLVCDSKVKLPTARQCTFNVSCSTGKVTELRLYRGITILTSEYVGPFYATNGTWYGELIKTFNSGTHYFALKNDGSTTINVSSITVNWDN